MGIIRPAIAAIALAVASCGQPEQQQPSEAAEGSAPAAQQQSAAAPPPVTAEQCTPVAAWTQPSDARGEIGDVHLGMPADRVGAVLEARGLEVTDGRQLSGSVMYRFFYGQTPRDYRLDSAATRPPQEATRIGYVAAPEIAHVIWIVRTISYPTAATRPTREATLAVLQQKYGSGATTRSDDSSVVIEWMYGPDGSQLDPQTHGACSARLMAEAVQRTDDPRANSACGVAMAARIGLTSGGAVVSSLNVYAIDHRLMLACRDASTAARNAARNAEDAAAAEQAKTQPAPDL